jgi:hypothetical protein
MQRPALLEILCIIGFVGAPITLYLARSSWFDGRPEDSVVLLLSAVAGCASLVGILRMRRWGALLYACLTAADALVQASQGTFNFGSFVFPAGLVAACAVYWRRFR